MSAARPAARRPTPALAAARALLCSGLLSVTLLSVTLLSVTLCAGCVDVPLPGGPPTGDAAIADTGEPANRPDVAPLDARPAPDRAPPDATIVDAAPDPPDAVICPAPCPHGDQQALYLPASRADAIAILDDGSVLVALTVDALADFTDALAARGVDLEPAEIPMPAVLDDQGGDGQPLLLHLEPRLETIRAAYVLAGFASGPIVDLWRAPGDAPGRPLYIVARYGRGAVQQGVALDRAGYAVIGPLDPDALADGPAEPSVAVIPAAGDYQDQPPGAALPAGFVAIDGAPDAPARSSARWYTADGRARPLTGLRHHARAEPATPYAYGAMPADATASELPLQAGDRCALRTAEPDPRSAQVYAGLVPDGNGGERIGRWPLDAFADALCPAPDPTPGEGMGPAPAGPHGWSTIAGRSVAATGVASDDSGATYVGFDTAVELGPDAHTVATVMALEPTGELRWYQRLRPEAIGGIATMAEHDQTVRGIALDRDPARGAGVVVMAEGRLDDMLPLWTAPAGGQPGFQGAPGTPGGRSAAGWLGRLDARDGRLLAATWIYRVTATPTPAAMRVGRLRCFIDEGRAAGVPQPVLLDPGALAVGPDGQVAVGGIGVGLSNTPDALQQTTAPFENPSARFVRIYDRGLSALIYATALGPEPADANGRLGLDMTVADMAFTDAGHLLVVGHQRPRDGADDGAMLPTTAVPPWADDAWPVDARGAGETRAFMLRLVPDPACGVD